MTEENPTTNVGANLQISGGAAIVAPISAFAGGVPPNALVVLPVKKPTDGFIDKIKEGPLAVTPEQMWELLGFNGPAVQVQDHEGRPLMIGANDLLAGLEKHWKEEATDLNRGRMYAQELMKHNKAAEAATVLSKVVAGGGAGEDWLALGVAQLSAGDVDKAEGTLKGAMNLLPASPFPALNLSKLYAKTQDAAQELAMVEKAISVEVGSVDAWAHLFSVVRRASDVEKATRRVVELAGEEANKTSAAPYIALQGIFAAKEETRDKAMEFARTALEREPGNALALISLSALHGQNGDLPAVIELLKPHEAKMVRDVRLANNYFEALMQAREMDKVTKLLNALMGSNVREVKQFAAERSRMVAQLLQQQQARLKSAQG